MQPDPYYQPDTTFLQREQDKVRKKKEEEKKKAFKPRMIVHPYFQNVSIDDAMKVVLITIIEHFNSMCNCRSCSWMDSNTSTRIYVHVLKFSVRVCFFYFWL